CGILPFFVTDRYRVHLVPPLAILAALAAQQVTSWWKSRSWSALQRATLIWIARWSWSRCRFVEAMHTSRIGLTGETVGPGWPNTATPRARSKHSRGRLQSSAGGVSTATLIQRSHRAVRYSHSTTGLRCTRSDGMPQRSAGSTLRFETTRQTLGSSAPSRMLSAQPARRVLQTP